MKPAEILFFHAVVLQSSQTLGTLTYGAISIIDRRVIVASDRSIMATGSLVAMGIIIGPAMLKFAMGSNHSLIQNFDPLFAQGFDVMSGCLLFQVLIYFLMWGKAWWKPAYRVFGYSESSFTRLVSLAAMKIGGVVEKKKVIFSTPSEMIDVFQPRYGWVCSIVAHSRQGNARAEQLASVLPNAAIEIPRRPATLDRRMLAISAFVLITVLLFEVWITYSR